MSDEQMQSLLDAWYRERQVPRPMVQASVARVMATVPRTRQRGRWWPLPAFDRPMSTHSGPERAPVPIPSTNGPRPERGYTMFSAVKFVAAAAIVALFGGFLLTGVLTTPQCEEAVPAAVTESPSPMTTEQAPEGKAGFTMQVTDDEVGYWDGKALFIQQMEASDPRLSGTWSSLQNCVEDFRAPAFHVCVGSVRVDNEGGSWLGRSEWTGLDHPYGFWVQWTVLEGQDGYEGLTAIRVPGEQDGSYQGVIFDYAMPDMPDTPPAAE